MAEGIKSRERVQKHGEVFTPDKIVNDMLDLIDKEMINGNRRMTEEEAWKYIDTTYLEPSCGTGNFLVRILDRKLEVVQKNLPKEQWDLGLLRSLCAIYAVDIQQDNVEESKERLLELIKNGRVEVLGLKDNKIDPFHFEAMSLSGDLESAVKAILEYNILVGNTLTGNTVNIDTSDTEEALMLTEYKWQGDKVAQRKLPFNNLKTGEDAEFNPEQKDFIPYKDLKNPKEMTDEERFLLQEQEMEDADDFDF